MAKIWMRREKLPDCAMRPELWARIEEIVQSAIDCPPENRPALIDAACGGDAELRRRCRIAHGLE
jgi:hypothetical protein